MNYALIFLVVMALVGTVYWLKPSSRERHLSHLREQARALGIKFSFNVLEIDSKATGLYEKRSGVFYRLAKEEATTKGELKFELVKEKGWYQDNLPIEYSWHKQPEHFCAKQFEQSLELLDDELLVLSLYENQVSMLCSEQSQATAQSYLDFLKVWLNSK